ncbi:MAG: TerB family tellurite resistance protein [Leptolyngbyaceae cyanobacterium bins.59]|nr:TerB family tellurite resistance protein [Leptolyngbyaceae cyanobacterium bins.59]
MALQPPPSISPRQMNLLRIVSAMAWSDGHLASEEVDLMLDRFSHLFSNEAEQQRSLQQDLREYLMQNLPLEQLISRLETPEERELVLRLGYEVICSSRRTPDEPVVNTDEEAAYQKLVQLLQLPTEVINRVESEMGEASNRSEGIVDTMVQTLKQFFQ